MTVYVMPWVQCKECPLTFCYVDWIPCRVDGFCCEECSENNRKRQKNEA